MHSLSKMPCGKKSCLECVTCKYDLPLGDVFKHKNNCMKNYDLIPVGNNPATAQIIFSGQKSAITGVDKNGINGSAFCNNCPFFIKIKHPTRNTYNTRCSRAQVMQCGTYRVIKLNVYENENVTKPFWCPKVADAVKSNLNIKSPILGLPSPSDINSTSENTSGREKWLAVPGLTAWKDIFIGSTYHFPPTLIRKRKTLLITLKTDSSLQAKDINTNEYIWLYKSDEEYKFMSKIK